MQVRCRGSRRHQRAEEWASSSIRHIDFIAFVNDAAGRDRRYTVGPGCGDSVHGRHDRDDTRPSNQPTHLSASASA